MGMRTNAEGRGSRGLLLWVLSLGLVAAGLTVFEAVPLVYPPMPPLPPGQEYVLDPAWKITLHHYISLRLDPPPPLTGAG